MKSHHDVGQGGVSGFVQSQVCSDNSGKGDTHQFQAPVHLSCDVKVRSLSLQFRGEGCLKKESVCQGHLQKASCLKTSSERHLRIPGSLLP